VEYKLLSEFRSLFHGIKYEHRKSNLGDHVASFLYEDLFDLGRSAKLVMRVRDRTVAVNTANVAVGKHARRGDGTFGEAIPGVATVALPGFLVPRGRIATIEIGAETKILAKAMIKQIDRVSSDLLRQVEHFRKSSPRSVCVGIVGINRASQYLSFEGAREFLTDGKKHKHPIQEAVEAEKRLDRHVRGAFDEFIVLRYSATNQAPFPFVWADEAETKIEYAASLVRISAEYESRF
jgi:hypothetical protein